MDATSIAIGSMHYELTERWTQSVEFDKKLWCAAVNGVTVYNNDRLNDSPKIEGNNGYALREFRLYIKRFSINSRNGKS